jgi:hypothetical protein
MKTGTKWIGGITLSIFILIILVCLYREQILTNAGKYMAPDSTVTADVAVLEGTEFIQRKVVAHGMRLLTSGRAKRLVIILHRIAPNHRPFGFNEDYPGLVKQELEDLGLKKEQFQIIVTSIHHPVTLTAARGALEVLHREGVNSAILLSSGFHTRRSFLAYQHVGTSFKIKISPHACLNEYELDKWWTRESGVREFAEESLKLAYYLMMGYIPLKLN